MVEFSQNITSNQPHTPSGSSSSAIDLTGTPTGLSSGPTSPALHPSDTHSNNHNRARRRSWGRVDAGQDPLNFQSSMATHSASRSNANRRTPPGLVLDDPFYSPTEETHSRGYPPPPIGPRGGNTYASQSSASLISGSSGNRDDDEARLTANISGMGRRSSDGDGEWGGEEELDPSTDTERTAPSSAHRKRTIRYSMSPSPLKKTGSAFVNVSRSLRRASLRVVNLAGSGLEDSIRLPDDDEHVGDESWKEDDGDVMPDMRRDMPIRGQTLGIFGPQSRVRLLLYRFLMHPWTEPLILVLIVINAVVLTIQASRSLVLSDPDATPSPVKGYFHTWEDWALFALFVFFTLEAFARICVTGLLLDPEVPTSSLSTSFAHMFSMTPDIPPATATIPNSTSISISRQPSLARGMTVRQKVRRVQQNLLRPFRLAHNSSTSPYTVDPSISATAASSSATLTPGRARSDTTTPVLEKTAQRIHHLRSPSQPTFFSKALRSDQSDTISLPFKLNVSNVHDKIQRNVPYLRHSWSRIDFVAITSFWICFVLAEFGVERGAGRHIGVFRAMSVLRTARLLAISSGTTTIMRSLKTARPLLTSVAYFVLFAMVLFSIIGVQSFKGSLRRACYLSPTLGEQELQIDNQFCGGYIDPTSLNVTGYIQLDSQNADATKGYICPLGQVCRESGNPDGNVESFDTIYFAALQVVIVASANGWSPLMYSMIDAEFFISCFFFIFCVIVLNFWLINLFVAVITNTFSAIRSDTKKSAFGAAPLGPVVDEQDEGWAVVDGRHVSKNNFIKIFYQYTRWCWVFLALASLVVQATRTVDVSEMHQTILDKGELAITFAFDLEIIIRILAELPDWRGFFIHGNNWLDLVLAIGCSIIQIPAIHGSEVYPWLTAFQLARFYRVILEVPRMRPLMLAVFGNMYGLVNMSLFLLLVNFIAALVAVQLLRGDVSGDNNINFGQIFNAFLGIYQVFSSENWTDVLYDTVQAEIPLSQAVILAIFVSTWMLFANFIVLQMFIAVINENFNVAEESKKGQQATHYWATQKPETGHVSWIRRLNPYRWVKAAPVSVKVENLPSSLVLPMQKALVQDYNMGSQDRPTAVNAGFRRGARHYPSKSLTMLQRLFAGESHSNDVPLTNLRQARRDSVTPQDPNDDETERHLEILAAFSTEAATTEDINDALYERRAQKADFIRNHPSFDKTFWIFSQKNPLRRLCQKLVQPPGSERIFGIPHSPIAHPIFQLVLLLTVIGGIVVESISTPIYRRNFYAEHGLQRFAWFDIAETVFGLVLVVEFLIKVVADGFLFTPNAYVRSIWNILDFFILAGLIVNLTTTLIFIGGLSRLTRSLKALRALRLITLIDMMRNTFQSLIISGVTRILDAAVLAILYMIPYAVWGLNIFAGKMNECNDSSVNGFSDCNDEYVNTVLGDSFGFPVPRVWDNPAPSTKFSFDNFRSSLLILFEIVSLEGWIDVMGVATSIVGVDDQPQTNASQVNAIFFLIYNLMGGVVILTLFVSIIIGNFSSKTGTAFLTQPQREWIDLQKLIKRQRPSKRPPARPSWSVRAWCFDRAVNKHGWWSRMMTTLFIIHIFALMTQTFSTQAVADEIRNDFFLLITFVYVIDILVRFFGLGWRSFRANGWNIFDIVVAGGSFITTLVVRFGASGFVTQQLQKLFLVSIAFKLVQRTNNLNKLFKTAMASLPVIVSLLSLWIILFIFFAILYVEVFSMTKWDSAETRNQNYSTVGSALVMLAFMTTGEGWNQYMHDYTIAYPRCTNTISATGSESDCGSVGWAFTLFIAWNLLSMYIFVNMFTGVVVENFSYVFQTAGGAKSITREEMRAFKKIWAEFANQKTRYLERHNFVPFFARLSGIFEIRIYPVEYSIPNIMASCKATGDSEYVWQSKGVDGVDLNKLGKVLNGIDYNAIRRRRNLYSRLFHEASISHQQGRGISFTDMLLMLAHHKLIVDREALVLKDLVVRTETNKLVTDLVNLDRVRSLLKMISHRRRFLAYRRQARATQMQHQDIPAINIVIEDMPSTPPQSTRDITSAMNGSGRSPSIASPSQMDSPDFSLMDANRTSLQRSRRMSDMSMLSTDLGNKYMRDSTLLTEEDSNHVISSMQNSMWGDMMLQAEEEDER